MARQQDWVESCDYTDYKTYHKMRKKMVCSDKHITVSPAHTFTQRYINAFILTCLFFSTETTMKPQRTLALWVWTKQVDEGPYWSYYTHMKWDPSVSWGGVLGDCGRGGEEDDRLFTAMKQSNTFEHTHGHTQNNKNKLHQQLMTKRKIIIEVNEMNEESTENTMINDWTHVQWKQIAVW